MAEREVWQLCRLWLSLAEIGAAGRQRLLKLFGGEEALFEAYQGGAAPDSADSDRAYQKRLCALRAPGALERAIEAMDEMAVYPIYPDACPERMGCLTSQPDAPYLLYARGELRALDRKKLAIVGTRRASRYGAEITHGIARELSMSGVAIISGLARGIDTHAHRGALQGGGVTIAVLGGGLGGIYPAENVALSRQITENGGLLLSEYPPATRPDRFRFPLRNRLIAWLSEAVLFAEGAPDSGGTITVDFALQAGVPVFALPGMVNTIGASGPHRLIREEKARLVACASDLIDDLGWLGRGMADGDGNAARGDAQDAGAPLDDTQKTVLETLQREAMTFDQLSEALSLPMNELEEALVMLEMSGDVSRGAGNEFIAVKPVAR